MVIQKMKALEIELLVLLIGSTLNSQVKKYMRILCNQCTKHTAV